jgi:AcrR family transcriptional regulator
MTEAGTDHRRATAERNVEAILAAAEHLLERGADASIAGVAAESGVSRVTVYAHFATRTALLEAVVERAVRGAGASIHAAHPADGRPDAALERVIAASWRELDRHQEIARAAAAQLSPTALRRSHESALHPLHELVERGQRDGVFRTDLPADWLVATFHSLIHAAADEVRAGRLDADEAPGVLTTTLRSVFVAKPRRRPAR